ncbi:hypothetical protein IAT38_006980 [Cryptococcus sp. DSM 104549]
MSGQANTPAVSEGRLSTQASLTDHQHTDIEKGDLASKDLTLPRRPWRCHPTPWSAIASHPYEGKGTEEDPFVVDFLPRDPSIGFVDRENPLDYETWYKWAVTGIVAMATLGVAMASSMLSAGSWEFREMWSGYTDQVYVMITSGFVIGFVVGPILWAPASEVFGRRPTYIVSYVPFVAFAAGCCGAPDLPALIVLRVFAGVFGSSAMVNSGGTVADMFEADQRGLAVGVFAAAPFLGPSLGPVIGGFLSVGGGWKWVCALIAFISLILAIVGIVWLPESYAPVLLRQRAARLSKATGKVYRSVQDLKGNHDIKTIFKKQVLVPWVLMFREPIVFLMSLYMSVIYAILYMQFTSFPLVWERARGWSPGIGGLGFLGITVGLVLALAYIIFYENPRYSKCLEKEGGYLAPESRLPPAILGSVVLPVGLFWFAWTSTPSSTHWIIPMIATVFIGAGIVSVFLSIMNYLVDAYLIYAASVIGGNTIMRSVFGVVIPLFVIDMFRTLGYHWAGSLIGFIAVLFAPCPIVFWWFGSQIRRKSKFAREADDVGKMLAKKGLEERQRRNGDQPSGEQGSGETGTPDAQQESGETASIISSATAVEGTRGAGAKGVEGDHGVVGGGEDRGGGAEGLASGSRGDLGLGLRGVETEKGRGTPGTAGAGGPDSKPVGEGGAGLAQRDVGGDVDFESEKRHQQHLKPPRALSDWATPLGEDDTAEMVRIVSRHVEVENALQLGRALEGEGRGLHYSKGG